MLLLDLLFSYCPWNAFILNVQSIQLNSVYYFLLFIINLVEVYIATIHTLYYCKVCGQIH